MTIITKGKNEQEEKIKCIKQNNIEIYFLRLKAIGSTPKGYPDPFNKVIMFEHVKDNPNPNR